MPWWRRRKSDGQRAEGGSADGGRVQDVALRLFAEGCEFRARGALRDAACRFERALVLWREMRALREEGSTLGHLALLYEALGEPREAMTRCKMALSVWSELREPADLRATLHYLGKLAADLGRLEEAATYYEQALAIARDLRNQAAEAVTSNMLGLLYGEFGQPKAAVPYFERALAIARELGNLRDEAAILNNLGQRYVELWQPETALAHYEQSVHIRRIIEDRKGEGITLGHLGILYQGLWQTREASACYEQALAIHQETGNRHGESIVLSGLGLLYMQLGRSQEALDYLQQSLRMRRSLGNRRGEGTTLANLGSLLHELGRSQEALAHCEQALTIHQETGNRHGESIVLNALALVSESTGQLQQAIARREQALTLVRAIGDRQSQYVTLFNLGKLSRSVGRREEARAYFEQAIELIESTRGEILGADLRTSYFSTVAGLYGAYVSLLLEQADPGGAWLTAERAKGRVLVDLLGDVQAQIRGGLQPVLWEDERRLLGKMRTVRQRLIDLRSRPQTAGDTILIADAEREEQELERAYQVNQAEIRRRTPRYAALTQPEVWEVGQIQRELLDVRTVLLEYVLGESGSFLFVVLEDDFEVFSLPPRDAIETKVRELRAAVVHGMHRYPHGHELYGDLIDREVEVAGRKRRAVDMIKDKDLLVIADGALHYLPFALLLTTPPAETDTEDEASVDPSRMRKQGDEADEEEDRIIERVEAALAPLPPFNWAGLPYLVRRHAISYASSATVAGMLRSESRERQQQPHQYGGELAAFADPVTDESEASDDRATSSGEAPVTLRAAISHTRGSLKRIPNTAEEVWALAGLLSRGTLPQDDREAFETDHVHLRTGSAATKDAVVALTSGDKAYRFFHVASHGLLDPEKPQFSGLVFSPGEGGDPYWQTFEIFNAHIPSELVVLSACETGLGKVVSGEGIVGLTRAFMYAGAPSVCVSLWKVADRSTPPLMEAFYGGVLAGEGKARALQRAQLRMLEGRYKHPFYWAPFVLVGEAR
jgi:tetratricopeptide (TPR) repeat protein